MKMRDRRLICNDAELGPLVFGWALRNPAEPHPKDDELKKHIARCEYCGRMISDWKKKGQTGRILTEATQVLAGRVGAGEGIDERQIESGRALFKYPLTQPDSGMLIIVNKSGRIESIDSNAHRPDFEQQ